MRKSRNNLGLRRGDIILAYTFLRLIVGINYFNHGFTRLGNIPDFVAGMVDKFQGTFIPEILIRINAALVPPVELIVGLLITIGLLTRSALIACFALMLILMYGVTLVQDWQVAGGQLTYNLALFILLAGLGFNTISVDNWWQKRSKKSKDNLGK
ncbi:MAG: DoxX family protein [Spirulinaceae cyanobacterium]